MVSKERGPAFLQLHLLTAEPSSVRDVDEGNCRDSVAH
jgi:hypothetical protein